MPTKFDAWPVGRFPLAFRQALNSGYARIERVDVAAAAAGPRAQPSTGSPKQLRIAWYAFLGKVRKGPPGPERDAAWARWSAVVEDDGLTIRRKAPREPAAFPEDFVAAVEAAVAAID
jgi:hypothetical protein